MRGKRASIVGWSDAFLRSLIPGAVLRYLAVAHYGRGRGDFAASEYPSFWREAVAAAANRAPRLDPILAARGVEPCDVEAIAHAVKEALAAIALDVLGTLYPDALPGRARSAENATPAGTAA